MGELFDRWVAKARAVPIGNVAQRFNLNLKPDKKGEYHGPCPGCRDGKDRFALSTNKQVFNCRICKARGGSVDLYMLVTGCTLVEAAEALTGEKKPYEPNERPTNARAKSYAPAADTVPIDQLVKSDAERAAEERKWQERALKIWRESHTIESTPVEAYLKGRKIDIPNGLSGRVLRYHPHCPFKKEFRPCMIALYRTINGDRPVAIHRTAITLDGRKATDVPKAKLMLGPVNGAAIKLTPDEEITYGLTVGEGIETTLSAMAMGLSPGWALGAAGAIGNFQVLSGIDCLRILVDKDENEAGQINATQCATRWSAKGVEVRLIRSTVGKDMNDALKGAS